MTVLEWPLSPATGGIVIRATNDVDGGWDVCLLINGTVTATARCSDWHRVERFRARARQFLRTPIANPGLHEPLVA